MTHDSSDGIDYYLELSKNVIKFDPITQITNVFFDDSNSQVFSVRSGGVTGVIVKGPDEARSTTFRTEDKGPVTSIKFSPDLKVLAIQRSQTSVEFINFENLSPTATEYSQPVKGKTSSILGFVWSKSNEIAFVTDHGIELYQVIPERKSVKAIKSISFSAAWYSWCPQSKNVLLVGNNGVVLQPFNLNNSTITKLPKVELDGVRATNERDVIALRVYGAAWCAVLRHGNYASIGNVRSGNDGILRPAEVFLLPLGIPASSQKQHTLKTGLVGRFAINVIDDLIVVHHQTSQTSMLFDIMDDGTVEGNVIVHVPVLTAKPLNLSSSSIQSYQTYSPHWIVFQPDIVIDARLGYLWKVKLNLRGFSNSIPKPSSMAQVVNVLLRRTAGQIPIFEILNEKIKDGGKYLSELSKVFDEINQVYRKWADSEVAKQTANVNDTNNRVLWSAQDSPNVWIQGQTYRVIIDQEQMYTNVLQKHSDDEFIVQVMTVYIASLSRHKIIVQHTVAELLATALVRRGLCHRLRQMIRHGCLGDSRPLACLLLSLGNVDPAAGQLALDMFWRLGAHEEVVEVLLGSGEVVAALGTARQSNCSLAPRKLLTAALASRNIDGESSPSTFISVYHALINRNKQLRAGPQFIKSEQCDFFVQYYQSLLPDGSQG